MASKTERERVKRVKWLHGLIRSGGRIFLDRRGTQLRDEFMNYDHGPKCAGCQFRPELCGLCAVIGGAR